jgi:hypothetical protein
MGRFLFFWLPLFLSERHSSSECRPWHLLQEVLFWSTCQHSDSPEFPLPFLPPYGSVFSIWMLLSQEAFCSAVLLTSVSTIRNYFSPGTLSSRGLVLACCNLDLDGLNSRNVSSPSSAGYTSEIKVLPGLLSLWGRWGRSCPCLPLSFW